MAGKSVVIDTKVDIPFDFKTSFNTRLNIIIRNMGCLPKTWLGKRSGLLSPLSEVNPWPIFSA